MKKALKNLILFLIIQASISCAFCYTLTSDELKNDILVQADNKIKAHLAKYPCEYKINLTGVLQNPIVTNENKKPKVRLILQNQNFAQNLYARAVIQDSNNNIIKAFPINIQTLVYADVLTACENIPYNREINSNNTKLERKEISKYLGKTYFSAISPVVTSRNYQKGSVILSDFVKTKSAVLKNSSIDIVFESKGLNIRLRGKALKDGAVGDMILVRSDKYNKTYNGIVKSENEVIVRI